MANQPVIFDVDLCLRSLLRLYDPVSAFEAVAELAFFNEYQYLPWDRLFIDRVFLDRTGEPFCAHRPMTCHD